MTAPALTTTAPPATRSRVRQLPVPECEPPFDDQLGSLADRRPGDRPDGPAGRVQGTLALAFVLPSGLPATPPPALHLVPSVPDLPARTAPAGTSAADPDTVEFGPQPTRRAVLPEPRAWAGRLVQAVVEVLAGDRPVTQLVRWTSVEVYEQVTELLPGARSGGEAVRAAVRSVHLTEPADGVAEVAATVRRGLRSTAVALRLEGLDGRWQCTALEVG